MKVFDGSLNAVLLQYHGENKMQPFHLPVVNCNLIITQF